MINEKKQKYSVAYLPAVCDQYKNSHYKDKTVGRPSYLYNGNFYTGKKASLYWDGLQVPADGKYAG